MEDVLHILAEHIALGVNLLGMLAITIGAIQGAIGLTRLLLFHADEEKLGLRAHLDDLGNRRRGHDRPLLG